MQTADIGSTVIIEAGPSPTTFDAAFKLLVAACGCRGVPRTILKALLDGNPPHWPEAVLGPVPETLLERAEAEVSGASRDVRRGARVARHHRAARLVLGIVRERNGAADTPAAARRLAMILREIGRAG